MNVFHQMSVCPLPNSSETAGHIFTILGECVVLIPGMVLIYFLKVTHPLGAPQGVFHPLDAQGRRASKFNVQYNASGKNV